MTFVSHATKHGKRSVCRSGRNAITLSTESVIFLGSFEPAKVPGQSPEVQGLSCSVMMGIYRRRRTCKPPTIPNRI